MADLQRGRDFFLSRDEIPADLPFARRYKARNHALRPLFGSRSFPQGFRLALERAARSQAVASGGFAVPALWARGVMGSRLEITLAPGALKTYAPGYMVRRGRIHPLKWFFVGGGEWDRIGVNVEDTRTAKEMKTLLQYRDNFRDSPLYREYLARAANGAAFQHRGVVLDTEDRVDAFFQRFLELLNSIERKGYRRDYVGDQPIGVAIGRTGEMLHHRFGHHRIAICQALGLEKIPAAVTFVHQDWLNGVYKARETPIDLAVQDAIQELGRQSLSANGRKGN